MGSDFSIKHRLISNGFLRNVSFIITTPMERPSIPHENVLSIHPELSLLKIRSLILSKLDHTSNTETIIGIDPGHNIGVALLQNQRVMHTNVVYGVNSLILWIKQNMKELDLKQILIKIGDGDPNIRDIIIDRLLKEGFHPIYLVDEQNTSVKLNQNRTLHEDAAIIIAERKGELISNNSV